MLINTYFSHWWSLRPRRLRWAADPNDLDLHRVEDVREDLVKMLNIKRKVPIYMIGKLNIVFEQNDGFHKYGKWGSAIYLTNTGDDMVFNLAHEMFHEYQHENYGKGLKKMSREQIEVEAHGFAVAYCEHRGEHLSCGSYKNYYLPKRKDTILPQRDAIYINHICFSDRVTKDMVNGMPKEVRLKADYYREQIVDKASNN